jgi:CRISPR type III-A-associated RAMP protein Csm4
MAEQTFDVVKLHFKGPLHISRGKDEYGSTEEILPSDALKSAIFACGQQLYDSEELQADFLDHFRTSSAFPFYQDEYFFPKPFTRLPFSISGLEDEQAKEAKKLKQLRYLGKAYMEKALNGEGEQAVPASYFVKGGAFLSERMAKDSEAFLFQKAQQSRVAIPHWDEMDKGAETRPFYMEKLYFQEGAGLYFLLDIDDRYKDTFYSCLSLLADNGIGTDRNVGNGQFTYTADQITIAVPDDAQESMVLSLYCPEKAEVENGLLAGSRYQLLKRGGFIASPEKTEHQSLRKKSLYMFTEGSIFGRPTLTGKNTNLQPAGDGKTAMPDHPIWRDGRPLYLPIKTAAL